MEFDSTLIGNDAVLRLGVGNDVLNIVGRSVVGQGVFIDGNSGRGRLQVDDAATIPNFLVIVSYEIRGVAS